MVMEMVEEEVQCVNHPYKKSSSPGGICGLCLQEKLGKLVSSSFSATVFPSSSSSPSPSFRSHSTPTTMQMQMQQQPPHSHSNYPPPPPPSNPLNGCSSHYHTRKPRLPFVLTKNRKSKGGDGVGVEGRHDPTTIVFKRSKSIATPKRIILDETHGQHYSPHRRGFWSFLYTSTSKHSTPKKLITKHNPLGSSSVPRENKREDIIVMVDENGSPDQVSYDSKVSRSRSVGCGSRSFSGDFFERISTGFGDCTLRRVESHREGNPKMQAMNGQHCIKQRVSCGGIFSGFMINSSFSSSSSSLSSSQWVAYTGEEDSHVMRHHHHHHLPNGRTKNWGWPLPSPMRAFANNKPAAATKTGKNTSPNLAAVPSLLAANA